MGIPRRVVIEILRHTGFNYLCIISGIRRTDSRGVVALMWCNGIPVLVLALGLRLGLTESLLVVFLLELLTT